MMIQNAGADGLYVITPDVFKDSRGYFLETSNNITYKDILNGESFVQSNASLSKKGVLRGLHYQTKNVQGKLVSVSNGSVIDVVVDLRKESDTYLKYFTQFLSSDNNLQFYVPPGFAHGFVSLEENTRFEYKCTDYYAPKSEKTLLWSDSDIGIDWDSILYEFNLDYFILSDKDQRGLTLKEILIENPSIWG
ncbi:dTDP-4-dehydrorhamnose 3,5-epimerase [Klebsiella phage 05F01]|nr:dTDP-4-dehydrorhamnose 3,5-epimerase [Klebsiella phage 05F01]